MTKKKIVLAIGGSSGSLYAKLLMQKLVSVPEQWEKVGVVMTDNAKLNWDLEIGDKSYEDFDFDFYDAKDFFAPFASGSAKYDTMIICPCSMGLLSRVSQGFSNDLITRAADVVLKERRKLILVPREAPYSTLHLENMLRLSQNGAIICPATPSFYSGQKTLEAVLTTVVDRVLDLAGLEIDSPRWGKN